MKTKSIITLFCGIMVFAATSCDNPGEPNFDNDEFSSVLYLKDSGLQVVNFQNVNEDILFTTSIGKGGTATGIPRTAKLEVFTAEELQAYNELVGYEYTALPADCYEYADEYSLDATTEQIPVSIKLKAAIGQLDKRKSYVLPLKLEAEGGVSKSKGELILDLDVFTPQVRLLTTGTQQALSLHLINQYLTSATMNVGLSLNTENPKWNFGVALEDDAEVLQQYVESYNATNGTNYSLLPDVAYTLPEEVKFASTEVEKYFDVNIDVQGTDLEEKTYLLPLALKQVNGMPFDVSNTLCYIPVNMTVGPIRINLQESDLSGNNSQFGYAKLVDGIKGSDSWESRWYVENEADKYKDYTDPTYGIYIDLNHLEKKITKKLRLVFSTDRIKFNEATKMAVYTQNKGSNEWVNITGDITSPFTADRRVYEVEAECAEELQAIRVALLEGYKGDLTVPLEFPTEWYGQWHGGRNVRMDEIELFGY